MRILTWNINGIRATNKASSIKSLLDSLQADIICLQETKITRSLLLEDIANVNGYLAFFSFSRKKGGYSGVVTYCKKKCCPIGAEEGLSGILTKTDVKHGLGHHVTNGFSTEVLKSLDGEGRAVLTEHKSENDMHICIINVYCPRADVDNEERYLYKMNFYHLLEARCKSLIHSGKHVIVVGDLNVSHKRIDHCDPDENFENNLAREWLDGLLCTTTPVESQVTQNDPEDGEKVQNGDEIHKDINDSNSDFKTGTLVDIFRTFHTSQKNAFTCWNTRIRARETNFGTRIDYILTNHALAVHFTECCIRPDILGSDHCPVQGDINFNPVPSKVVPELCAIFMPELSGKQIGIKCYFSQKQSVTGDISQKQSVTGDISIPQKRSSDDFQGNLSKNRKLSNNKESKNSMFKYFKSNKSEAVKSGKKKNDGCPDLFQSNEKDNEFHDLVMSDEIWASGNYVCESKSKAKHCIAKESWKNILKGPDPTPLCSGHKESSVLRTVKKEGANLGRQFYACNRPVGHASNKEASCEFFQWKK